jgi:hypothetical protein
MFFKVIKKIKMNNNLENADELDYFEIWKEYNPVKAYLCTLDKQYEGKLLDNTDSAIDQLMSKMTELRNKTKDRKIQQYLDGFIVTLKYQEPFMPVTTLVHALSSYLFCQRPVESLSLLLENSFVYLRNAYYSMQSKKWTLPILILTQLALKSLFALLDHSALKNVFLDFAKSQLHSECYRYYSLFQIPLTRETICEPVIFNDSFDNIFNLFHEHTADRDFMCTGRSQWYPLFLNKKLGYQETPFQLLASGMLSISDELESMKSDMGCLSKKYNIPSSSSLEKFADCLSLVDPVKPNDLLSVTRKIQSELIPFIDTFIADVPKEFVQSSRMTETPLELCPIIPCAAAYSFCEKTPEKQYVYFITTNVQYNPIDTFSDLINLLIHEQFGHNLHYWTIFNSQVKTIDTLENTFTSGLSEGIAFHREFQFMKKLNQEKTSPLLPSFILERLPELRFITKKQRLIRYCRIICDIFINLDIMTVPETCKWIEDTIGISARTMFYNFFPCHQGIYAGFATTYAVIGNQINELEKKLLKPMKEFNKTIMECGYQPLSLIIKKMTP